MQAPKTRQASRAPSERNARLMLYGLAGSGVVALAAVIAFLALSGGSSGSDAVAAAMKNASCTYKVVKGDSAGHHVAKLDAKITYNTFPPSSGTHYFQPAVWDFYTEPVSPVQAVHNLEHGGIVIWWGPKVTATTVDQLRAFYDDDPVAMLGTPLKGLGDKVALSAWTRDENNAIHGRVAVCPRYDEKAFKAFRDAFRGKGPEAIPVEQNQPGT